MTDGEIRVEAWAKINVFLRVLGRRGDGYHDVESLVVPISLADELSFEPFHELKTVVVVSEGAEAARLGERNLVDAAAQILAQRCRNSKGAHIRLQKRIPVAAGLGGGSADAAVTLLALNEMWGCGLSREDLMSLGAEIGSDVPALLHRGPVFMRGRGQTIESAAVARTWWVLKPQSFPVSTPEAYAWWDERGTTGPNPRELLSAAADGRLEDVAAALFNDLETGVVKRHPEIVEAKEALLGAGALAAVMSGSGPTVAGLAGDEAHAGDIARGVSGSIPVSAPP